MAGRVLAEVKFLRFETDFANAMALKMLNNNGNI